MYVQGKLKICGSVYGLGSRGSKPYVVSVKSDVDLVRRPFEGVVRHTLGTANKSPSLN